MPEPHHLIVVANRTCPCPGLADEIHDRLDGRPGRVHVVAPALNRRLRHYLSDSDEAFRQASERLAVAVELLRHAGIAGSGEVGDADPLLAVEDALVSFPAHGILISTWPEGRSNWLEKDLLARARERFQLPVDHVVSRYDLPLSVTA